MDFHSFLMCALHRLLQSLGERWKQLNLLRPIGSLVYICKPKSFDKPYNVVL